MSVNGGFTERKLLSRDKARWLRRHNIRVSEANTKRVFMKSLPCLTAGGAVAADCNPNTALSDYDVVNRLLS